MNFSVSIQILQADIAQLKLELYDSQASEIELQKVAQHLTLQVSSALHFNNFSLAITALPKRRKIV